MSDSQSSTEIFTIRIVSIDYYMAPPIPDADICYSSFHGTNPALCFFFFTFQEKLKSVQERTTTI